MGEILLSIALALVFIILAWACWTLVQYRKDADSCKQQVKDLTSELSETKDKLFMAKFQAESAQNSLDLERSRRIEWDDERLELLDEQYRIKNNELEEQYAYRAASFQQLIDKLNEQVKSLSNTKSSIIEAVQRERVLQEQENYHHLNIDKDKQQDIDLLRSIQFKLSNPRILSMLIWQTYYQPVAKKNFVYVLGKDNVCGIYKITSMKTEMNYIGQAKNVYKRWTEHCKCGLGIDTPRENKLYKAMLDEGLENFTFELLEKCSEDELDKKESYYIEAYNAVAYGFNGNKGAKN